MAGPENLLQPSANKDRQIDQIRQNHGFALQNGLPTNLSLGNRKKNQKLMPIQKTNSRNFPVGAEMLNLY